MRKISFNDLTDLVSKIDADTESSFPIFFNVDGHNYRAGMGIFNKDMESEMKVDVSMFFLDIYDCLQYLSRLYDDEDDKDLRDVYNESIIDICDSEATPRKTIAERLKILCDVYDDSEILLYDDISFSGEYYEVCCQDLSDEVINKEIEFIESLKEEII